MKRFLLTLLTTVLAIAVLTSTASAVAAKFHRADASIDNNGALVVSWDQRGLGEGDVNYNLSAFADALWACINGGNNHPQAANKESFQEDIDEDFSRTVGKNGRIVSDVSVGPPQPVGFSCPNGQRLVIASVTYTDIVLSDLTNGVSVSLGSVSRTFIDV